MTQSNVKKKNFDVLAWKDRVQSEIYEETKHMTREEWLEYLKRSVETGPFADLWKRIEAANRAERKSQSPDRE